MWMCRSSSQPGCLMSPGRRVGLRMINDAAPPTVRTPETGTYVRRLTTGLRVGGAAGYCGSARNAAPGRLRSSFGCGSSARRALTDGAGSRRPGSGRGRPVTPCCGCRTPPSRPRTGAASGGVPARAVDRRAAALVRGRDAGGRAGVRAGAARGGVVGQEAARADGVTVARAHAAVHGRFLPPTTAMCEGHPIGVRAKNARNG